MMMLVKVNFYFLVVWIVSPIHSFLFYFPVLKIIHKDPIGFDHCFKY